MSDFLVAWNRSWTGEFCYFSGLPGYETELEPLYEYTFFAGVTAAHEFKITALFLSKKFQIKSHFKMYYTTRGSDKILSWKVLHKGYLNCLLAVATYIGLL